MRRFFTILILSLLPLTGCAYGDNSPYRGEDPTSSDDVASTGDVTADDSSGGTVEPLCHFDITSNPCSDAYELGLRGMCSEPEDKWDRYYCRIAAAAVADAWGYHELAAMHASGEYGNVCDGVKTDPSSRTCLFHEGDTVQDCVDVARSFDPEAITEEYALLFCANFRGADGNTLDIE